MLTLMYLAPGSNRDSSAGFDLNFPIGYRAGDMTTRAIIVVCGPRDRLEPAMHIRIINPSIAVKQGRSRKLS